MLTSNPEPNKPLCPRCGAAVVDPCDTEEKAQSCELPTFAWPNRAPRETYPDPTPEMLNGDPLFEAIWRAIKGWDISRHNDGLYSGPTGNDARHIYDAIKLAGAVPNGDRA